METNYDLNKVAISIKSHKTLKKILRENPDIAEILKKSRTLKDAEDAIRKIVMDYMKDRGDALAYYKEEKTGQEAYDKLSWQDFAAIRILDYLDNSGQKYKDLNLRGGYAINEPFAILRRAVVRGSGGASPEFFEDMLFLFRQFRGSLEMQKPDRIQIEDWMEDFTSGLDKKIVKLREENRNRIIKVFIEKMDMGKITCDYYKFDSDMNYEQKFAQMLKWWEDYNFHLRFAVRTPDLLNELLDFSVDPDTMNLMHQAEKAGIPFFVNPYYLSLVNVRPPVYAVGADLSIRDYIFYSKQLVEEFGDIVAWEKEDKVEPGKPNAAGWILPTKSNVHRRYPEVAILIPDTTGRACGGLCSSCQRMYDFQRGNLNFDLEELKPVAGWSNKLKKIVKYWEDDSQLRDILITGGDALMNSNKSLKEILDNLLEMIIRKKEANKNRPDGEKYAEILRIRLGTRLLAYLPQRVNERLLEILTEFRQKAKDAGVKQFVIQTHFQTPSEITPEAQKAVKSLQNAGWMITNQHVFKVASSRRGHTAQLRKTLNEIGVLSYYIFSVKGYMENSYNFSTNARAVQEQIEEKIFGDFDKEISKAVTDLLKEPETFQENLAKLLKNYSLPFISSGRNVLNLPGVGKSMTFRVIGITRYGRRILSFDHDHTRSHSPVIHKLGKVVIIESKSIAEYLQQLYSMGENPQDYRSIWGYSIGETEKIMSIYEYPEYDFKITDKLTNNDIT
jgi:lysine 2,3-aminomutase